MFNIGDKVRWKKDAKDGIWYVEAIEGNQTRIYNQTRYESKWQWVDLSEIELINRHDDIKQAIREMLLSDEFLAAFAKAFVNAPTPSTIQPAVISTQVDRSIAQEAFEWFKSEDVFLNG